MPADATFFHGPRVFRRLQKLFPGGAPDKLPVTLHRHRIYIIPTRYGLFFGLLLFTMLLGALNYNNNLALLLTFLLVSMTIMATVHTYRNLAGLRVTACRAQPVFAGESAAVAVELVNPEQRPRCMLRGNCDGNESAVSIGGGESGELHLKQRTYRRGWQPIPRIRLYTVFPLGMFRAWSWLDKPGRVLVYPRPETGVVPQPYDQHGHGIPQPQDGEEFAGLRAYRSGDPSRLIAWKALARTDELLSKEFHAPRGEALWLDFHALAGLDTEGRLSRLARWVLDARRLNLAYGLELPGRSFPPDNTVAHYHACLRALALFGTV